MSVWILVGAALVFVWGAWDYFHSDHRASTGFVYAVLGLGVVAVVIVSAMLS